MILGCGQLNDSWRLLASGDGTATWALRLLGDWLIWRCFVDRGWDLATFADPGIRQASAILGHQICIELAQAFAEKVAGNLPMLRVSFVISLLWES